MPVFTDDAKYYSLCDFYDKHVCRASVCVFDFLCLFCVFKFVFTREELPVSEWY